MHVGLDQRGGPGHTALVKIAAPPRGIDRDHIVRSPGAERHLSLQLVGGQEVVAVEKLDPYPPRGGEAHIAGDARTAVFRKPDHSPVTLEVGRELAPYHVDRVIG